MLSIANAQEHTVVRRRWREIFKEKNLSILIYLKSDEVAKIIYLLNKAIIANSKLVSKGPGPTSIRMNESLATDFNGLWLRPSEHVIKSNSQ